MGAMVHGSLHPFGCHGSHTQGADPKGQPFGGGSPGVILPRVFLVELLPILTDLYRLSWEIILSHRKSFIHIDYLFTWLHVFFSEIVLWRNYLISRVELFEEKSILVFPECLEASE